VIAEARGGESFLKQVAVVHPNPVLRRLPGTEPHDLILHVDRRHADRSEPRIKNVLADLGPDRREDVVPNRVLYGDGFQVSTKCFERASLSANDF